MVGRSVSGMVVTFMYFLASFSRIGFMFLSL